MRKRKGVLVAGVALIWLTGGCCGQPGLFDRLGGSLKTVQSFYEPLLQENLGDERVRRAVVAADTTLMLAGELQKQWCPDPRRAEQLELQTKEAGKLAQEAGVVQAGANQSSGSGDSTGAKQ